MSSLQQQIGSMGADLVKHLFISLTTVVLMTGAAQGSEWLRRNPVSFYETQNNWAAMISGLQSTSSLSLSKSIQLSPQQEPMDRPYGFGRELDDTSPTDYPGLKHDASYFFGYQFFIVGLLYVMPESISAWTDEQKEDYTVSKWWGNVTHPRWDPDEWYINYILHPYWGMTYYNRGRERGLTESGAFWFSFTLSAIYEFGLEAMFEPVSYQDVIFTPGLGSLLGWYFEDTRREIKSHSTFSFWDKTILLATDPLGALNEVVDGMIGTDSELELRSFYHSPNYSAFNASVWDDPYLQHTDPVIKDYLGLQLSIHW